MRCCDDTMKSDILMTDGDESCCCYYLLQRGEKSICCNGMVGVIIFLKF